MCYLTCFTCDKFIFNLNKYLNLLSLVVALQAHNIGYFWDPDHTVKL